MEQVIICQDIFHISQGKKPKCTKYPCLILNIHVKSTFIALEIHSFQCLWGRPPRQCMTFMRSYTNVTSESGCLRPPGSCCPSGDVCQGRQGVGVNQAMHWPSWGPLACLLCHLTSPEAPVHIVFLVAENKGMVLHGDLIHSQWLHACIVRSPLHFSTNMYYALPGRQALRH